MALGAPTLGFSWHQGLDHSLLYQSSRCGDDLRHVQVHWTQLLGVGISQRIHLILKIRWTTFWCFCWMLETTHVFVEGAESELGKRFPFGLQTYKEPKLTTRVFWIFRSFHGWRMTVSGEDSFELKILRSGMHGCRPFGSLSSPFQSDATRCCSWERGGDEGALHNSKNWVTRFWLLSKRIPTPYVVKT